MSRKKATIGSSERDVHLEPEVQSEEPTEFGNLRELIFLGRIERIVTISNYNFKLRTLNGTQQMATLSKTMVHGEGERLSALRSATLAESITDVNGVSLESLYDGDDDLDSLSKKMYVISNLQTSIIDRLYLEYDALMKESNEVVGESNLKK
jgi:hypothetical protein